MRAMFRAAVGAAGLLAAASLLRGQELPADQTGFERQAPAPRRKTPSFFHRPAKATPAEQYAYARQLADEGRARRAAKQYLALVHAWHQAPEAPLAQEAYARYLLERQRYERAFEEFQYLFDWFAGAFEHEQVLDLQFRIANAVRTARRGGLGLFPGFAAPERALPLFQQIVKNAPYWERAPEAQYMVGSIHEENQAAAAAAAAYEVLRFRYPRSPMAAAADFGRARCLYRLAQAAPRDEEAARRALQALGEFLRHFPEDEQAETARSYLQELRGRLEESSFQQALFYDRTARNPQAAAIAYRQFLDQFPASERRAEAERRLRELRASSEAQP